MFEMYHIALFTGIIISIFALSSVQTNEEMKSLREQLAKRARLSPQHAQKTGAIPRHAR